MPQDARRSRSLIGPFEFRKAAILVEATPMRAGSISQLLTGVTLASELSIFYHLHQHFLVDPNILPDTRTTSRAGWRSTSATAGWPSASPT